MDVERAQTNIRKVCLTASIAGCVSTWTKKVLIILELVARVKHFIGVHDLRALIQILDRFFVVTSVNLHASTIQIVVFFVENVFFVVVCLLCFLCISLIVTFVSALRRIRTCLKLSVQLDDLVRVKVTDVFKLILFLSIRGLLHSESEIISLEFTFFKSTILLLTTTDCSDLVHFGSLGRGNHL